MKNLLMAALVMGAVAVCGCDEKKDATSTIDQMKNTASKAGESVKSTVNAATTKLMDEVKGMVDTAKAKLDGLTKGGANLTAEKKTDFDKVLGELNTQFKSLSEGVTSLKDASADTVSTKLGELKTAGTKLMDDIKAAAEKFGIKL